MEYKVNSGIWGSMFGVPDIVADNFLKLASGEQIKVLLYLLRYSGRPCSAEEISMNTGVTPQQAADAVIFWTQANILTQQNITAPVQPSIMTPPPVPQQAIMVFPTQQTQNTLTAPPQSIQPENLTTENKSDAPPATISKSPNQRRPYKTPTEIKKIMENSKDISDLFKLTENILGPINHTFQNSLIWIYDYLGLKIEVIYTLINYCKKIDKTNPAYIEKIASEWSKNDINDLKKAEIEIQRITVSYDYTGKIMKMFEMTRRPTSKESEFIEQWRTNGYSDELIHSAYEKTLEQINKLSFVYINKILMSWRDSNFKTVKDVRDAESDYKKRKTVPQKTGADPDIEKYKVLINKF